MQNEIFLFSKINSVTNNNPLEKYTEEITHPESASTQASITATKVESIQTPSKDTRSIGKTTLLAQPNHSIIHVTGSISTKELLTEDFESEHFHDDIKKEIQKLLESNTMVVDALVSITDLEKTVPLNRQKRSTINAIIRFTAVCSLGFGENSDIEPSIRSSITRAEPRLYDFFDEQSFSSFNLEFEHEPKIVTIEEEIKSENEITDVIGKLSKL